MKKLCLAFLLASVLLCLLSLSTFAAERYVTRYTFDTAAELDDFSLNDAQWTVEDGKLCTTSGSGSAILTYDIPAAYAGMDFDVDVDFIGHTSTGGILIGGEFDGMPAQPTTFFGYDCFTGSDGSKAALGLYNQNGAWNGNIVVGQSDINTVDLHLTVAVRGNTLTYRVFTLDGSTQYFGTSYTIGVVDRDIYTAMGGKVGLRKFFSDGGAFDNFTLTVYPDVLPGELSKADAPQDFSMRCSVVPENRTVLFFGMQDTKNGFAAVLNQPYETVGLYAIQNGTYALLAEKKCPIPSEARSFKVSVIGQIAYVYYQDNLLVDFEEDYPKIEFPLDDYAAGKTGYAVAGGTVSDLTVSAEELSTVTDGYLNPVTVGADPDVLFYEGTYYLYNRATSGSSIFRASISPDLVHWTTKTIVFTKEESYTATGYMSPNVFYHDGVFYLFYAAKNPSGDSRLYCATSDSPLGPFTHKRGQVPLHEVSEIGGHPFMDDDGRFYLTYCRFGKGNAIWIEELTLEEDGVTPVDGTLRELIVPKYEYEINGFGRISEGGVIKKHNGYYYMIYASGHYKSDYGESYAVAENVLGPYTRYEYNDILSAHSKMNGVGDSVFISSPDGTELFMVYHCHKDMQTVESRNTCIDRIRFVQNPDGGPDLLQVLGPTVTEQEMPSNMYRYDLNRDGRTSLIDALICIKFAVNTKVYDGRYDINGDCRNGVSDAVALLDYMWA